MVAGRVLADLQYATPFGEVAAVLLVLGAACSQVVKTCIEAIVGLSLLFSSSGKCLALTILFSLLFTSAEVGFFRKTAKCFDLAKFKIKAIALDCVDGRDGCINENGKVFAVEANGRWKFFNQEVVYWANSTGDCNEIFSLYFHVNNY